MWVIPFEWSGSGEDKANKTKIQVLSIEPIVCDKKYIHQQWDLCKLEQKYILTHSIVG